MLAPETLFAFISAALLVIAVPGPAMLMVLGQLRHSRVRAVAAVAGLVVGDLLLISAAGLGLATLLRQWPLLLTVLWLQRERARLRSPAPSNWAT